MPSAPRPAIAPTRIIAINPPSIPAPVEPSVPELPPPDPDKTVELKALATDAAFTDDDDAMHEAPTRVDLSDLDVPDSVDSSDRITPEPMTRPSPKIDSELTSSDLASDHSSPALAARTGEGGAAPLLDDSDPGARTQETESAKSLPVAEDSDGVDVDVDSDSAPPPTSDEAEVAADDLVSIESVPLPKKAPSVPPMMAAQPVAAKTSGEIPAVKDKPVAKADGAPPVAAVPPASPATPNGGVIATPAAAAAQAALADPSKKRIRTWWEDLFNDDFVRTMAKVTDDQIAREAKFIEESLGVAGGAALLDLACGTGLHAIELTKRGYQVVGFDLSLAMLARARG